jgi:hypothetical protein
MADPTQIALRSFDEGFRRVNPAAPVPRITREDWAAFANYMAGNPSDAEDVRAFFVGLGRERAAVLDLRPRVRADLQTPQTWIPKQDGGEGWSSARPLMGTPIATTEIEKSLDTMFGPR